MSNGSHGDPNNSIRKDSMGGSGLEDEFEIEAARKNISFEDLLVTNRVQIVFLLAGVVLVGLGVFFYKNSYFTEEANIEVLEAVSESQSAQKVLVVEISGAVQKPGVYELPVNSRIEDLLIATGGVSEDADRIWMERNINRAAKLTDGQKVYIAKKGDVDNQSGLVTASNLGAANGSVGDVLRASSKIVNVNTASAKELEALWGIGPVTAQNIIEQRPYSTVEELLTKKILKSNVYERNKEILSVY
jgi:competence protein ComEA